jgi:hypothetical protein
MRGFAALTTITVLAAASAAWAAPPGFAFLEVPAGARAAALGGAYASLATGAEAAFWNPAGTATLRRLEVTGGHAELLDNLRHDYFTLGGPLWGGAMTGSVRALYTSRSDESDDVGNLIGSFGATNSSSRLGYCRNLSGRVSRSGGTASVIPRAHLETVDQTYALGVGAAWTPERWNGLRPRPRRAEPSVPSSATRSTASRGSAVSLPMAVQTGRVVRAAGRQPLAALGPPRVAARSAARGLGCSAPSCPMPRAPRCASGTRINDDTSSLSFGAGFAQRGYALDYAFVPLKDDLGDTQRFAFRISF